MSNTTNHEQAVTALLGDIFKKLKDAYTAGAVGGETAHDYALATLAAWNLPDASSATCTSCNGAGGWGAGEDAEECHQCNGTGDQPATAVKPTASGAVGLSPCPCCPQAIRNLHAVAHNICTRTPHIHDGELKRAVDQVKPLMDAHFADPEHSHGAALAPHRGEGGKHG